MIAFLKGKVAHTAEGRLYLEVNQVGFEVFMSQRDLDRLKGGMEVMVYTYLHVKEDLMQLYGFLRKEELELFKLVISVNGIGPKGALGIFSVFDADSLRFAIFAGDSKKIAKAPGIGAKTAQKLILELKDKVSIEPFSDDDEAESPIPEVSAGNAASEAAQALIALGYGASEATKAAKKAAKEAGEQAATEKVLQLALKYML